MSITACPRCGLTLTDTSLSLRLFVFGGSSLGLELGQRLSLMRRRNGAGGRPSNSRRAVECLPPPTSRPYRKLRRGRPFVYWRFRTVRRWPSRRKRRRRRIRTRSQTTEARHCPLPHFAEEGELISARLLELVLVAPSPPAVHDHLCGWLQPCKRRRPIRRARHFSASLRGAEGRPRGCPFLFSFAGSTGSSAQRPLPGRSELTRPNRESGVSHGDTYWD